MRPSSTPMPVITVAAVVIVDRAGRLLTVRKSGAVRFMLPGGKPENGESRRETALRESREELSVELFDDDLVELGVFRADAANEAGHLVEATVFEHRHVLVDAPAAEIAELRWIDIDAPAVLLAPLLADHVLPLLRDRRRLS